MVNRFRPAVERVEDRVVPSFSRPIPDDALVVSPDDGGVPHVKIIDPVTGEDVGEVEAFQADFRGGVRAATGDVNHDGVNDLVVAAGPGGGPRVKIIDGASGATLRDFFAYESTFSGGVYVALADVNHDGFDDLVLGTGRGGAPRVRVLSGADLGQTVLRDFFAYEDSFRGGVLVAAGDVDDDGTPDLITGTGVGGGPRVVVFGGDDGAVLRNFFAYDSSFRDGVLVGSGDIDGDGTDDILTGAGVGGGPHARGFSGRDGHELLSFFADDSTFRGGVRVGAVDVNGDGRDDFVTHTRHGNDDFVQGFDGRTGQAIRFFVETVDDNPSNPSSGPTLPPGAGRLEGTVTAVNVTARTVSIRTAGGAVAVAQAGPATKVERNNVETSLSAFRVGDAAQAEIGADGVATKIEATGP